MCLKGRIVPPHKKCIRLISVICAAIPDIKLWAETKVRCTIKDWCNFNRFNTVLNGEILLNLIRKTKCLTDKFQSCFCFCISNTKYIATFCFCSGNTIGILTDNVLVATCNLSCLCIPVPNAVVEWLQSCYFCVQDVEKLWFWMCLRQVQCCVIFACFKLCFWCF